MSAGRLSNVISIISVVVAYLALAALSTALAYAPTDAWTVWLASGLILGLLVAQFHYRWAVPLAGAAVGAAVFALILPGGSVIDALGYAAIEVIAAAAGAFTAMWLAAPPLRLDSLRQLGAFVVGALAQALAGARCLRKRLIVDLEAHDGGAPRSSSRISSASRSVMCLRQSGLPWMSVW